MLARDQKKKCKHTPFNRSQINSWLLDVCDKWEKKLKEQNLQQQQIAAESQQQEVHLKAWEWKLRQKGLHYHKTTPNEDATQVPPTTPVSNLDLPA